MQQFCLVWLFIFLGFRPSLSDCHIFSVTRSIKKVIPVDEFSVFLESSDPREGIIDQISVNQSIKENLYSASYTNSGRRRL